MRPKSKKRHKAPKISKTKPAIFNIALSRLRGFSEKKLGTIAAGTKETSLKAPFGFLIPISVRTAATTQQPDPAPPAKI